MTQANNEVSRLFMYAPGNKYDDCDYSRFFGKGCIQRYNYYHGTLRPEIKTAHVDCLQTFTNNGEIAQDLLFEYNTCFDFHQMCMVESAPHIGSVRGWTFRHNITSANAPTMRGGWGPDIVQTLDVTIRAMPGEKVTISGADLIEGWQRQVDGSWSVPLAADDRSPLRRDGRPWREFHYDPAAQRITVKTGGDPRLHVFEIFRRAQAIDLAGRKDTKIEGIIVVDILKAAAVHP